MAPVFCTVLSKLRVYQAVALIYSLDQVLPSYFLYILCVDKETSALFSKMRLRHVCLLCPAELGEKALDGLRKTRKLNEYCWTLKPILIEALFCKMPHLDRVTYADADLFFYGSPMVIFEKQADASVLLSRGDITQPMMPAAAANKMQSLLGRYNSGFISFKRDQQALACLEWWKNWCMESCLSNPSSGRFGDQRYLDEMPYLFHDVREIETPGVNIGHWNSGKYDFSIHEGHLCIGRHRLICYHFSGFRILNRNEIVCIYETGRPKLPFFYRDYSRILLAILERIQKIDPSFDGCSTKEDIILPHENQE